MIEKPQTVLGKNLTGMVETAMASRQVFSSKGLPSSCGIQAQPTYFSPSTSASWAMPRVVAQPVVGKMSAEGIEAIRIKLPLELFRRQVVSARQFDIGDPQLFTSASVPGTSDNI